MDHFASVRSALEEKGIDALLVTGGYNRRYVTGFPSSAGMAVITKEEAYFFVDSRYIEAATAKIPGAVVREAYAASAYVERVNEVLEKHGVATLGFEEEEMNVAQFRNLEKSLKAALVPAQEILWKLRAVKTPEELEIMHRAQRTAEAAYNDLLPRLNPGMTEREAAYELTYLMMQHGAEDSSFDPIFVSGSASSMPHGVPRDVKLQKGFLTMDFGALVEGYCSDTTRTVCLGQPTQEMREVYEIVRQAQAAGIAAAKGGALGSDIDGAARRVISDAGYGPYFGHSFGHCLGMEIHEPPYAASRWEKPVPAGAVISAEPGIYLPGKFGVRIEDVLILTPEGNEDITDLPKDLVILDF
jgi:Xaa-Pro aminopeptidase